MEISEDETCTNFKENTVNSGFNPEEQLQNDVSMEFNIDNRGKII